MNLEYFEQQCQLAAERARTPERLLERAQLEAYRRAWTPEPVQTSAKVVLLRPRDEAVP